MQTLISYVRSGQPDLTNRQMALLMLVYLTPGPHTVRGLAHILGRFQAGDHARLEYAGHARLSAARPRRGRPPQRFRRPRPASDRSSLSASNAISSSRKAPAAAARPRNGASSSSTDERFTLGGPSVVLDPRIHAWRSDIADIALAGRLFAPHYARPLIRACGLIATPGPGRAVRRRARRSPSCCPARASRSSTSPPAGPGAIALADHRVGYVEAIELAGPLEPTHVVVEAQAPIQAERGPALPRFAVAADGLPAPRRGARRDARRFEGGFVPLSYLRAGRGA